MRKGSASDPTAAWLGPGGTGGVLEGQTREQTPQQTPAGRLVGAPAGDKGVTQRGAEVS